MIDTIVIATTTEPQDQALIEYCKSQHWDVFAGSQSDVLQRYFCSADAFKADHIVRVTSDCPLIDPATITKLIKSYRTQQVDYLSTNYPTRTYPVGYDCEVMSFAALKRAYNQAVEPYDREHVTPYIYNNPQEYRLGTMLNDEDLSWIRITLDTAEDYALISGIYEEFFRAERLIDIADIRTYLSQDTN